MADEMKRNAPLPEQEPQEIVSWYTAAQTPEEIVSCYVHPLPLPRRIVNEPPLAAPDTSVWREAAQREKRRRRLGVWIFVGCMATIALAIGLSILLGGVPKPNPDRALPDDDDNNASSIVDIMGQESTDIPRYTGDSAVRLRVQTDRGDTLTAPEVYAKVNPAVVTVVTEVNNNNGKVGTGVIFTPDGYVITNAHVISEGKSCAIILDTGYMYDAQLVGYDTTQDLAVLHAVDAQDLPTATFGDSDRLAVGETVYAIGNPLGVELRGTFTNGMVSAVNRDVSVSGGGTMTMIQTTAALNSGNSGGPLINEAGQVIGINTMKMSNTSWEEEATVEGLGFAIPISTASFVINDLIATGEFRGLPTIGISVITTLRQDGSGTQVEVYSVDENFGAAQSGVQPGDIVLEADGVPIRVTADLLAVRRKHVIGDTMHLTLLRGSETIEADIVLRAG